MKRVSLFFLLGMFPSICGAGIGEVDKRFYPDWNQYPYSNYVRIQTENHIGTGQFVSPRHILTNKHVANCCGVTDEDCIIELSNKVTNSKGDKVHEAKKAKLIATSGGLDKCAFDADRDRFTGKDWAVLEITDALFLHDYFQLGDTMPGLSGLTRAGFGGLRVLTDQDVRFLKESLVEYFRDYKQYNEADVNVNVNRGTHIQNFIQLDNYEARFKEKTGSNFKDLFLDSHKLKAIKDCQIKKIDTEGGKNIVINDCYGWSGDSGSALINSSNSVAALFNSAQLVFGTTEASGVNTNFGLPISTEIKSAIENASLKNALSAKLALKETISKNITNIANTKKQKDYADLVIDTQIRTSEQNNSGQTKANTTNVNRTTTKSNTSTATASTTTTGRKIGNRCLASDLPAHASIGNYVKSGLNKFSCEGVPCACAATRCEDGYYLVINSKGHSQGWCYTRTCPSGTRLNVIDGYKTDTKCIATNK